MGSLIHSASGRISSKVSPGSPGFYPWLEYLQGRRLHSPSGKPLPIHDCSHSETIALYPAWTSFQCMYIDAPLHLPGGFSQDVGRLLLGSPKFSLLWTVQAQLLHQVGPFCTSMSLSWMHNCSDGGIHCLFFVFSACSTLDACIPVIWQGRDTCLEWYVSAQIRNKTSCLETSGKFHTAAFFLKTNVLVDPFKNAADKRIMCQCFGRVPKAILGASTESYHIVRVR